MAQVCVTPSEVLACIEPAHLTLIAIDGFPGSGKSALARKLSDRLGWQVVGADDYLNRNRGGFVEHLRLEELNSDLERRKPCVFEGLCALQTLESVNRKPDLLVYVKRMSAYGWAEGPDLEDFAAAPELQQVRVLPTTPIQLALRSLWVEVCSYHLKFEPQYQANIVYERGAT